VRRVTVVFTTIHIFFYVSLMKRTGSVGTISVTLQMARGWPPNEFLRRRAHTGHESS